MFKTGAVVLASIVLAACAPTAPATTAMDVDAKRFETAPGTGAVYVLRGSDSAFLTGLELKLDGAPLAWLGRRDYVRIDSPPGRRRITCGEGDTLYLADVAAGQTLFVEAIIQVGWMTPRCSLVPLDDLNGRERVMMGTRVATPG
ncbi:hypothetical protein FHP25_36020 [Vineibacter terrae]|uniref:DUF2846 domain-containing protein n=1 Tax=Vineibacter terrae TaxID=2586908 RepID=A0A5C8P8K1_9HYPH|nr:hypothetical protein [Vineibacter terrae]TXL70132.1 hypothetical protein FHP25_36020 [Vineibacter terrae]